MKKIIILFSFLILHFLSFGQQYQVGQKFTFVKRFFMPYPNIKFKLLDWWTLVKTDSTNKEFGIAYYFARNKDTVDISDSQIAYKKNPRLLYSLDEYKAMEKKNGAIASKNILSGLVWIGMTADQAIASWGHPESINHTLTKNNTREQWVYGETPNSYLYFANGKLTTIQD